MTQDCTASCHNNSAVLHGVTATQSVLRGLTVTLDVKHGVAVT